MFVMRKGIAPSHEIPESLQEIIGRTSKASIGSVPKTEAPPTPGPSITQEHEPIQTRPQTFKLRKPRAEILEHRPAQAQEGPELPSPHKFKGPSVVSPAPKRTPDQAPQIPRSTTPKMVARPGVMQEIFGKIKAVKNTITSPPKSFYAKKPFAVVGIGVSKNIIDPSGQATIAGKFDASPSYTDYSLPKDWKGKYATTSQFGVDRGTHKHSGIDYAMPKNTPLNAAHYGKVTFVGKKGAYGNVVMYEIAPGHEVLLAHLNKLPEGMKVGSVVKPGTFLGLSGNTGRSRGKGGGYHMHYETRVGGKSINPKDFSRSYQKAGAYDQNWYAQNSSMKKSYGVRVSFLRDLSK